LKLRIRATQPEDFAELFALDHACFAPGIAWSKAELGYFLKYPGNIGVIAEGAAAEIAGFAIAGVQRRHGAVIGRLITIDVRAERRRQGVGQLLYGAIEERVRAAGARAILLEVAVDNAPAQAFYERNGFARTGRIPGYYLGKIDALVMEKPL
jgi:[ribosomal protein S18]-alanine N-acetyltransferase